ncbi:MAG: LapA family protein [Alphaproteobacteria bacterium]
MKQLRVIGLGFGLVLACLLALANRAAVVFSLDPISPASDDLSVQMPLYGVIFIALFIGVLLGGLTVWLGQRQLRLAGKMTPVQLVAERDSSKLPLL